MRALAEQEVAERARASLGFEAVSNRLGEVVHLHDRIRLQAAGVGGDHAERLRPELQVLQHVEVGAAGVLDRDRGRAEAGPVGPGLDQELVPQLGRGVELLAGDGALDGDAPRGELCVGEGRRDRHHRCRGRRSGVELEVIDALEGIGVGGGARPLSHVDDDPGLVEQLHPPDGGGRHPDLEHHGEVARGDALPPILAQEVPRGVEGLEGPAGVGHQRPGIHLHVALAAGELDAQGAGIRPRRRVVGAQDPGAGARAGVGLYVGAEEGDALRAVLVVDGRARRQVLEVDQRGCGGGPTAEHHHRRREDGRFHHFRCSFRRMGGLTTRGVTRLCRLDGTPASRIGLEGQEPHR